MRAPHHREKDAFEGVRSSFKRLAGAMFWRELNEEEEEPLKKRTIRGKSRGKRHHARELV